jgi:outer membrane protein OmpA-like peptidoglycan-associated protein
MYCRNWVSGLYDDKQYTDLIATELAGAISLTVPVADQAARIETALAELRRLGEGLPGSLPSASAIALEVQRLNALRPDEVAEDLQGGGTSTDADNVTADSLAVIVARLDFLEQVLTADGDTPGRTPPGDTEVVRRSNGFDVYFSTGSSELTHSGRLAIGQAARRLATREVIVTGFADARGSADLNRQLSQDRADAVATELRAAGFVVRQSVGVGEEMTSSEAYSGARRVQVLLVPAP